ncbi:ABC transporter permease [Herbiconiux sp. P15]|uniref:ABC transporter permease n=1 Tax=Herbiconiux liukaitaii TaxID=3342799 RepID=UPI0035B7AFE1
MRRAGFDVRDLAAEVLSGIGAKPLRLVAGLVGTVVGIGALVLTVGLGETAGGQVASRFDSVAARYVEVTPQTAEDASGGQRATTTVPDDAVDRVRRLAGVQAAAALAPVPSDGLRVSAVPVHDPTAPETTPPSIRAASGDLIDAIGGQVLEGRSFDSGHESRGDRVVLLGQAAAEDLGIDRLDSQPSVFLGERAYTVIGILGESATHGELASSAVIPLSTARRDFSGVIADTLALHIAAGASELVAHQAPIALAPNETDVYSVSRAPSTTQLQSDVDDDVGLVFLVVGLITLLAGGLGIANITTLSVSERTGEIGLRRALGATRRQIAVQFIAETVLVGLLGGVIGVALAIFAIVAVAAIRGWTPILDLPLSFACAALGGAVGLVAGAYPAAKAARTEPADALRATPT